MSNSQTGKPDASGHAEGALPDTELERVSGGLNPQPLPPIIIDPHRPVELNPQPLPP